MEDEIVEYICENLKLSEKIFVKIHKKLFIKIYNQLRINLVNSILKQ